MEGMGSVVATVSGYHGSERFRLIKLISIAGANYVGALTRSTTHLVCWKFEGKKHELAKKFGTIIVNHQWLEDCIKAGKHIPERPYSLRSGKEVGHITLDPAVAAKQGGVLTDNTLHLKKSAVHDRMKKPVIDLEIEDDGCDEDWLLNENLLPGPGSSGSFSLIYKRQAARKAFKLDKQENRRSNNCRAQVSALDQLESEPSSSVHKSSTKHRRSEQECTEHTALAESSRKRRLVKKNAHRDVIGSALSTADTQCSTGGFLNTETLSQSPSNNFIDQLENEPRISRKPESASAESAGHEDFLEIGNLIDISVHSDEARGAVSREVQEIGSDTDDVQGERETRNELESSTSAQLSCVICWTEFSLTRGILPCGHRFCFSCIQSWADRMVESKKSTTCPLCKATFSSITKVDGGACFDQKIYSQTIPSVSSTQDIVILPETGQQAHDIQVSVESACCGCGRREPVDLLIYCNVCQIRCVHSSCLDPPLFPWVCNSCKDLRFFSRYFL